MADPQETPGGERIEELLGQLKSIFGKLSEAEEQEAKQKIGPPPVSPPPMPSPTPTSEPPKQTDSAASMPAPIFDDLNFPANPPPSEPTVENESSPAAATEPVAPTPEPTAPSPSNIQVAPVESFIPSEVTVPAGGSVLPTAIFYPEGREAEAKIVAQKVERITPKFTKVSFVLNVQSIFAYNPKVDLRETLLAGLQGGVIKAVLVLTDKAMDEAHRKSVVASLEPKGIYFQEILLNQIEKKALYTDMLLGMVFFFDSQKPSQPDAAA